MNIIPLAMPASSIQPKPNSGTNANSSVAIVITALAATRARRRVTRSPISPTASEVGSVPML